MQYTTHIWERPFEWRLLRALPLLWQSCTWLLGWLFLILFTRIRVYGAENLRKARAAGVLLAANHESDLDGVLMLAAIPPFSRRFPIYYVAKARRDYEWRNPIRKVIYQEWFLWLVGAFPLVSRTRDYAVSLALHIELLKSGDTVAIFPEGTYLPEQPGRKAAHGGALFLAEAADVPIIPIRIHGTEHMTAGSFLQRKHTVSIQYLPPVLPRDLIHPEDGEDRYKKAAERLLGIIYA